MSATPIITLDEWRARSKPAKRRKASRGPSRQLEHIEQCVVVEWLRKRRHFVFSVPNAAARSPQLAAFLKKEGFLSGAPDLVLITPPPVNPFKHVAIEMKRKDGIARDVTDNQLAVHAQMREHGWDVIIAFGAQQAIASLEELGY